MLAALKMYPPGKAPTATLTAVATPFNAVTNTALKELITAAAQFRAGNNTIAIRVWNNAEIG